MILDLDIGNTRCKWRVVDARGEPVARGAAAGKPEIQNSIRPTRIRIARVADSESHWRRWAYDRYGIEPEFARATATACGVVNGYDDPARLGVDRWLALCAAYSTCRRACAVVDAGSAITVDAISRDGRHTGGYIVPGVALLGRALAEHTDGVACEPGWTAGSVEPGRTTRQAVAGGIALMTAGVVERALGELANYVDEPPVVYLTGGDADLLARHLRVPVTCEPELVLQGIALVLP